MLIRFILRMQRKFAGNTSLKLILQSKETFYVARVCRWDHRANWNSLNIFEIMFKTARFLIGKKVNR